MKKNVQLIFLLCCLFSTAIAAQIVDPVKWTFTTHKISDCEVELIFKAKIDDTWHLYGQKSYGGEGPVPTSFHFVKNQNYQLVGKISEKTLIKEFEPVWGFELEFFEHQATFKQTVKIESDKPIEIKGNLEFMVCTDVNCLPPTKVDFLFKLDAANCLTEKETTVAVTAEPCVCDTAAIAKAYGLAHGKLKGDQLEPPETGVNSTVNTEEGEATSFISNNKSALLIFGILTILFFLYYRRKK